MDADVERERGFAFLASLAMASLRAPHVPSGTMKMSYRVEIEREDDGRWIADVTEIPGAMAYGSSADDALAKAVALALHVIADRLEHGEGPRGALSVSFEPSVAA